MGFKTYIGYKPYQHQRIVHDYISSIGPYAGQIIVVKSKRQVGKSYLIEQELLRHAINYPGSTSICLSITFSNCKKIFKELYKGIKDSGIVSEVNKEEMTISLVNGSEIVFKSAMQREQLRGYTVKKGGLLCIDEAAYLSDDTFGLVSPWCDVANANILMVSTPRLKQGFFYDYFTEGLTGSIGVKSFDINDFDTSYLLSEKRLELYRRLMPRAQFESEYLGMFIDELGGVFKVTGDIWWDYRPKDFDEIFIGIDFGTGKNNDYTAISGFDASRTQRLLEFSNGLSPTEQIDWLSSILNTIDRRKIRKVYAEENSIGTVYLDLLRKRCPDITIDSFTTTNDSKRIVIENMIASVNAEEAKFIRGDEQYREIGNYMMEITPSGKITYNGALGVHDDIVIADALALHCIDEATKTGSYSISVVGKNSHRNKGNIRKRYEKN